MGFFLPFLAGAALSGLASGGSSKPEPPERMDYDVALQQARKTLTPQYEESREDVMGQIDNNLINRGFYGQAPGDAMKADTMADMQSDFQSQLQRYAQNLQNQQYADDYQTYQTNLQQYNQPDPFWQGIGGLAGQFMAGPGGESVFNWLVGNDTTNYLTNITP
jgi:hypothetical protein